MNTTPVSQHAPVLANIRTKEDKKEHYINTQWILSFSPSKKEDETDIVMINGKTYTIKGTPAHHIESYKQDVKNGAVCLNLIR